MNDDIFYATGGMQIIQLSSPLQLLSVCIGNGRPYEMHAVLKKIIIIGRVFPIVFLINSIPKPQNGGAANKQSR